MTWKEQALEQLEQTKDPGITAVVFMLAELSDQFEVFIELALRQPMREGK